MNSGKAEAEPAPSRESGDDGVAEGAASLEGLKSALAEAEERATSQRDLYLRSVAELENIRKRAQRDVENASRYGLEKFAQELLPVKDSLDLAVENAPRADARSLAAGQEATQQLLAKAFEKLGIKELDPHGEPFDPAQHEAVMAQESATAEPDTVLQVVQRGYELNGRLLRPARVIVSRAPAG
jgi:molecular chaperone GrpE